MSLELFLAGLVAVPLGFAALRQWKLLIWAVMFLFVFEGAIRKWLLPGLQAQVYLFKDALLIIAYVGFIFHGPPRRWTPAHQKTVRFLMSLCVLYYLIEVFNPNSPSILLSIAGFKNYALYFPLAFIVAHMFTSRQDLEMKIRRYAWVMIPVGVLGLVQFSLGPAHWLNAYVAHEEGTVTIVSQFGGGIERARTAGTFSYLSGYVTFLTAMIFLSLGLIIGNGVRLRGNVPIFALMMFSIAAMFTTGSRMGVLSVAVAPPAVLLVALYRGDISASVAFRSIFVFVSATVAVLIAAPDAFDAFLSRTNRVEDGATRFLAPLMETWGAMEIAPILGTGLATTHGGLVRALVDANSDFYWLNDNLFELESARIVQETGVIGFLLNYVLRFFCTLLAVRLAFSFRDRTFSALSAGLACFFALHMILYLVGNPTAAIFYWFGVGLLFAMWHLEQDGGAPQRRGDAVVPRRHLQFSHP